MRQVAALSVRLAAAVGVTEESALVVRRAALLHDVGKICLPESILLKPGRLNEQGFAAVKRHTIHGAILWMSKGLPQSPKVWFEVRTMLPRS
ncbi:MAG: HD domain-containing protein [Armatimonadota bacterium]|nr:HD domain-containing protein [Armatimonadota bacterium]MDR7538691.1 HD domain-containing protein [Armatimonadota bacterium]